MASQPFSSPLKRTNSAAMLSTPPSKRARDDSEVETYDTEMEDADSSPTASESQISALGTEPVKKAIAEASRALLEAIERTETIYGSEVGRTKGKSPKMTIQEASEALIEAIKEVEEDMNSSFIAPASGKRPRNPHQAMKAGFWPWTPGFRLPTSNRLWNDRIYWELKLKAVETLYPRPSFTLKTGEKVTYGNNNGELLTFIQHNVYVVLEKKWLDGNGEMHDANVVGVFPTLAEASSFARYLTRESTDLDNPEPDFTEFICDNENVHYECSATDEEGDWKKEYVIIKQPIMEKDQRYNIMDSDDSEGSQESQNLKQSEGTDEEDEVAEESGHDEEDEEAEQNEEAEDAVDDEDGDDDYDEATTPNNSPVHRHSS